jgi:hypothetical protein
MDRVALIDPARIWVLVPHHSPCLMLLIATAIIVSAIVKIALVIDPAIVAIASGLVVSTRIIATLMIIGAPDKGSG